MRRIPLPILFLLLITLIPTGTKAQFDPETPTPWIVTATPTATPSAPQPQKDAYEPNDEISNATWITLPGRIDKLNFYPQGDVDYFRVSIKENQSKMNLTLDTYADIGIDTYVRIFDLSGAIRGENDDVSPNDQRSHITGLLEAGDYIIQISNKSPAKPDFKNYSIVLGITSPSPQPTTTPEPNAASKYGGLNYTWDTAIPLAIGEPIVGLNFGCPPWEGGRGDCFVPDFFKINIKTGTCYAIETYDLQPGIDTNIIIYSNRRDVEPPIAGNDDRAEADFSSYVKFCAPYTGIVYILIGQGAPPPPPIRERTYSLLVRPWVQPTITPTTIPTVEQRPTDRPVPPMPSMEPMQPQPTLNGNGRERLIGVIAEKLDTKPTAMPKIRVPIDILACYDRNKNKACDADEGIAGIVIYVTYAQTGQYIGQTITDTNGHGQLTTKAEEDSSLMISIPYFGTSQVISVRNPQVRPIIIAATAAIPRLIP